jgi:hypothetical protein
MNTPQPFMYPRNPEHPLGLCFGILRTGDGFRLNFVTGEFEADPTALQVYRPLVNPAAADLAAISCGQIPPLPYGASYAATVHPLGGGPVIDTVPIAAAVPANFYHPGISPWAQYSPST